MCGRTACTLAPDDICKACKFKTINSSNKAAANLPSKQYTPFWRDHPGSYKYYPSANIAPSKFTPILINDSNGAVKRNSEGEAKSQENVYLVQPMMWGVIPTFHKGLSPTGHGYKTNNCRIEDIENKKLFKPILNKNQRCVVLCDGFYEWQTNKGEKEKTPYFVFAKQDEGISAWINYKNLALNSDSSEEKKSSSLTESDSKVEQSADSTDSKTEDLTDSTSEWTGPRILKMAGLYSVWHSTENEEVWSYTVITMSSAKPFSEIHNRIPAILDTEEEVKNWLDCGRVPMNVALKSLTNTVPLTWHKVSNRVNNSRNQDTDLFLPKEMKKPVKSKSSELMTAWLKSGGKKDQKK